MKRIPIGGRYLASIAHELEVAPDNSNAVANEPRLAHASSARLIDFLRPASLISLWSFCRAKGWRA